MYKEKLVEAWVKYQEVILDRPYSPDNVQGHGMAFAFLWNSNKEQICKDYNIDSDDFNYSLKTILMPKIMIDITC